uniref:glucuronosyltransferase n=1 Tax=Pristionchus pacificus TaxID=54126 RepID=A0A8R1YH75_PRIPA
MGNYYELCDFCLLILSSRFSNACNFSNEDTLDAVVIVIHSWILVYNPKFGHSHTNFMARIADILAEAGHEVTSLMPVIDPSIHNCTTKSRIIPVERGKTAASMFDEFTSIKSDLFSASYFDVVKSYRVREFFGGVFPAQCRVLLDNERLMQELQAEKFDGMIVEHFDMCGVGLVELIKPTAFISVSTATVFGSLQQDEFGIPSALSYDPAMFISYFNVHSIWDRLWNLIADWVFCLQLSFVRNEIDALFQEKFGKDYPSVREIGSHSAYVFVNAEPLIDYAAPTISQVIYIAGIGAKEPKKLDVDWEAVLLKRPRSVLISFGSMVKSIYLPDDVKMAFVDTFRSFPDVTFIWKYEAEDDFAKEVGAKVDNIVLSRSQEPAGFHHSRRNGIYPRNGNERRIFVPVFAEQPRNAGMMEHNGLGKVIDKHEMANASKIIEVLREVLENPSYYDNAQRTAAMLRSKPFSSREQLIKYTEFAAEFGPSAALRPQSFDMNWIEYNNADIIAVGVLIIIIAATISVKIILSVVTGCSIAKQIKND